MGNDDGIQVVVSLRLDSEGRPEGSVRRGEEPAIAFVGWLSLMAELHRLALPAERER